MHVQGAAVRGEFAGAAAGLGAAQRPAPGTLCRARQDPGAGAGEAGAEGEGVGGEEGAEAGPAGEHQE